LMSEYAATGSWSRFGPYSLLAHLHRCDGSSHVFGDAEEIAPPVRTISPATPAAPALNAARPFPRPRTKKASDRYDTGQGLLSLHRSCPVVAYSLPLGLYPMAWAMYQLVLRSRMTFNPSLGWRTKVGSGLGASLVASLTRKCWTMVARTRGPSMRANCVPMQMRGPPPKGK